MSNLDKAIVNQIYDAIWNQRSPGRIVDHFATDFLGHSTTEIHGPEGMKQWAAGLLRTLPDGRFTAQDQIVEGDKVVTRWQARGTLSGVYEGLAPTGKTVTLTGVDIYRIAGSKIIEGWLVMSVRSANHEAIRV